MEDSFFGFDTNLPEDEGNLQIIEPSEEEYDALNDETFGSAINGDWETAHESLVRLTGTFKDSGDVLDNGSDGERSIRRKNDKLLFSSSGAGNIGDGISDSSRINIKQKSYADKLMEDSDLELELATLKIDDVDLKYNSSDNIGGRLLGGGTVSLNATNVWSSEPPIIHNSSGSDLANQSLNFKPTSQFPTKTENGRNNDPTDYIREHFSTPFQQAPLPLVPSQGTQVANPRFRSTPNDLKLGSLCRLEDIERGILNQQQSFKKNNDCSEGGHREGEIATNAKQISDIDNNKVMRINDSKPQTPNFQQRPHLPMPPQMYLNQPPCSKIRPCVINTQTGQVIPLDPLQQSPQRTTNNFANNMARHPLNIYQQVPSHPPPIPPQPPFINRLPPGLPFHSPNKVPHLTSPVHSAHTPLIPPHPLLNQHPVFPCNYQMPPVRPMPNSHLPIALNNFAMHPNFNAIRDSAAATRIHPAALLGLQQQNVRMMTIHPTPPQPPQPMVLLNNQNSNNANYNMFNMRLVQEIQQNHPLLQNATRQVQQQQQQQQQYQQQQQQMQQNMQGNNYNQNNSQSMQGQRNITNKTMRRDGNLPAEEFDDYANLMSTRDKHWLIGIQLSQLNTDTPYIDDYYYTIYKKRKVEENGDMNHSEAHKSNQLNHPLTQPKGHAQLILVQLGNKNGLRNGHQHKDRLKADSEQHGNNAGSNSATGSGSGIDMKLPTYLLSPLKFENSLGKLQYVSVTAPRKIIDAEIMNNECTTMGNEDDNKSFSNNSQLKNRTSINNSPTAMALRSNLSGCELNNANNLNQRKCRHILLHIENLYRIILKLDDLNDPLAISTILAKKKKENERIAALEQLEQSSSLMSGNNLAEDKAADSAVNTSSNNPALKTKFNYDIETKDELIEKLLVGLKHDKVVAMMNVRKGKMLLRRVMVYLSEHESRWIVWVGIFSALQGVLKRDRDDSEGILYAFYPEFKKQIEFASFEVIVNISEAIALTDSKKSTGILCSKFGISSLVCLILQAERIYVAQTDSTLNEKLQKSWRQFLNQVAISLNRTMQNQTICAAIESNSIQPIMDHFARFEDLKLDSLLALITEAKQQIN